MKKFYTLIAALVVAAISTTAAAQVVYCMPGSYQGWKLETNHFTDNGDGTWSMSIDELSGEFKVVRYEGSAGWGDQWGSNGEGVKAGVPYEMKFKAGGPDPANTTLAGKSTIMTGVTVTITPGENDALTLLIEAESVVEQGDLWYLVGATTGWSFNDASLCKSEGNGVYTKAIEGEFKGSFKFVKNGAWSTSYGTQTPMEVGVTYTLDGPADLSYDNNIAAESLESPIFTITDADGVVTAVINLAGSGIEDVVAENGEATYYNLQGVKVANPENGVFIKVNGNNVSKVRF